MYKLYWVKDNGYGETFDLSEVLEKYGSVFVGRLTGEDAYEARGRGLIEESFYSLYIFRPGEFYRYLGVEDGYVSRRHALLELREGGLFIMDHGPEGRGSTNGTFINGRRIKPGEPHRLDHGYEVSLGSQTRLRVTYSGRPLTIRGPIELGGNDVEILRNAGLPMDVRQAPATRKPLVYIRQEAKEPVEISGGIMVIVASAQDLISNTISELEDMVSDAINKVEKEEGDARLLVKRILIELDMIHKDIEDALRSRDAQKDLDRLKKVVKVLEMYSDGYIGKEMAIVALNELRDILRAIRRSSYLTLVR